MKDHMDLFIGPDTRKMTVKYFRCFLKQMLLHCGSILSWQAIVSARVCIEARSTNTWKELMNAGLLLVSLLAVGLPSAALGLEMSGALGRLSVSFLPAPVRALLTPPGLGRFACAAAGFQLLHAACLMACWAVLLPNMHPHSKNTPQSCTQQSTTNKKCGTGAKRADASAEISNTTCSDFESV